MALSYYDDTESPSEDQGDTSEGSQESGDSQSDSGKTALINSDICPGMKPGDKLTLTVDKVLDSGEYQVSYMPNKQEESGESESQSAPASPEMAGYME